MPETHDVHETYLGEKGALLTAKEGVVCFDFSTIAPGGSQAIAREAAEKGAIFLDTPVSGSEPSAISAELNVMVGGDEAAMNAHRDVLEAVSETINYFGPNGAGLHMKLVANQIVSVFLSVVSEGLTLGERSGLDPGEMMDYLKNASIPKILAIKGSALASRDYTPYFRVDLMRKDLRLISEMAEARDDADAVCGTCEAGLHRHVGHGLRRRGPERGARILRQNRRTRRVGGGEKVPYAAASLDRHSLVGINPPYPPLDRVKTDRRGRFCEPMCFSSMAYANARSSLAFDP